jgi:hypothetical protein
MTLEDLFRTKGGGGDARCAVCRGGGDCGQVPVGGTGAALSSAA